MVDVKEPTSDQGEQTPTPVAGSEPLKEEVKPESQPQTTPQEETVPRNALIAERRKWQQRLREARRGTSQPTPQNAPENQEAYVRQLEGQVAESQLKDKVRTLVKDYPELPKHIKRAILRNPLGFVNSGTRDVEGGILDIQDYVEEMVEGIEPATPPQKEVAVAGGNTPTTTQPGVNPADIQAILNKDIMSWTKEEEKLVAEYQASRN